MSRHELIDVNIKYREDLITDRTLSAKETGCSVIEENERNLQAAEKVLRDLRVAENSCAARKGTETTK
ncbi:hypothetical protein H5410_008983 [Solanum commersonii]|uniref:Uncharacterized protein n=1 Tax=Solanum commersonii TaxID=4109 RepID=A0A9J6AGJ2_SOLCO|nr:hypothetical protein H5410_008983 [Solanum commersonii]